MDSKDIVLNGVSLVDLKKQIGLIRKDAVKFISNSMDEVKPLIQQLKEAMEEVDGDHPDYSVAEGIAKQLVPLLTNIKLVSNVTGVEYYLDYHDDWYSSDGIVITSLLDDFCYEDNPLGELHGLAGEMEGYTRNWNTSSC